MESSVKTTPFSLKREGDKEDVDFKRHALLVGQVYRMLEVMEKQTNVLEKLERRLKKVERRPQNNH